MLDKKESNAAHEVQGILLVDKPRGRSSFSLVSALRKRLGVKKIGHAGTLDPFATGLVVMLVGRNYTRLSNNFLGQEKEYLAKLQLGITTDTFDCDGKVVSSSETIPSEAEVLAALAVWQGEIEQIPPMFSAKKIKGQKLYELARKGITIDRKAVKVTVAIECLSYLYPFLQIRVTCSKGTYIRSLAHDIGATLGCGAHLVELRRLRSGSFQVNESIDGAFVGLEPSDILCRLLN